jgi:hypothetical protein
VSDARRTRGKAVINGELQYLSVSSLEKADTRKTGCARKWAYRYVHGVPEPETPKQAQKKNAGTGMHADLAKYSKTGDRGLGAMALKALASGYVPPFDPARPVMVEQDLDAWGLTAGGVPVIGQLDHANDRALNHGAASADEMIDPPGTVEVLDWKWKSGEGTTRSGQSTLLEPAELVQSIQMSGYGTAVSLRFPTVERVRLSHVYVFGRLDKNGASVPTSTAPRKVTRLVMVDEARRSWEYADALGRSVRDIARERNIERVDANRHACDAYGGCGHREYCTGYRQNSLSTLFGESATMGLMETLGAAPGTFNLAAEEQHLRAQQAQIAAGQVAVSTPTATPPGTLAPALAAPGPSWPVGFPEAWRAIQAAGQGYPSLAGGAAAALAQLCGQAIAPGAVYAGAGALAGIQIADPIQVLQLAGDFGWRAAAPVPAPIPVVAAPAPAPFIPTTFAEAVRQPPPVAPSILPPDAPASNPALAAKPIEGFTPATPFAIGAPVTVQGGVATPVAFGTSAPAITPPTDQSAIAGTSEAPKAKRGRPRKNPEVTTVATVENLAARAGAAITEDAAGVKYVTEVSGYEVFVDCVTDGTEALDAYIDGILNALVAKFCPPPCLPDVRCAPKDSPLGYGGHLGAISALVRERPPAPGRWSLRTHDDPIRREVADALRVVCDRNNGLFVRGLK